MSTLKRAFIALIVLSSAVPAGCGEGSEQPPTRPIAAAQGSSFDAPAAPKAIEPKEEVAATPAADAPVEAPKQTIPVVEPPVPAAVITVEPAKEIPPPAPPAPKAIEPEPKKDAANEPPMVITFAKLANYRYSLAAPRAKPGEKPAAKSPIPEAVRALDGKKVTIEGYMIPLDVQKGKILSFILSRGAFGCCYADSPQINEVIKVVSADGKAMSYQSMPRVTGILEVGEEYDPDGYIDSIYRIKADSVVAGKER